MIGRTKRHLYKDGRGTRMGLPKLWVDSLELGPGADVEVHFDRVLVVVPAQFERSRQAARVLRALREEA